MAKKDEKKKGTGAAKASYKPSARKPNVKRVVERKEAAKGRKAGAKSGAKRAAFGKGNPTGLKRRRGGK